jgi:hypothetical protein
MKLWKVQKFFGDLVYDLRSRGLLPVVILLLVAMVAVPILLMRGSSSSPPPAVPASAVPNKADAQAQTAVVSYTPPALRDYKERLGDHASKNPFAQPAEAAEAEAAATALNSTVPTPSGSASGSASAGPPVSGGSGSTGTATTQRIFFFHSVADVSFGEVTQPLQRHKTLKTYAFLPSQTAPVLVYLGSTLDEKRALFSVSKYTDQLTGQGTCAPGPTDCSLLALGPGETEDMVYAGDGKTYRVKVNSIQRKIIKPQG